MKKKKTEAKNKQCYNFDFVSFKKINKSIKLLAYCMLACLIHINMLAKKKTSRTILI
jgi:hypothetical protein